MKKTGRYLIVLIISFSFFPFCSPVSAQTPLLLGMTREGGSADSGTIVIFNPAINRDSVMRNFTGYPSDGANPVGNFVFDSINGLFYGTTRNGGSHTLGAIFAFNPATNQENVEWNFKGGADASYPLGSLVYDKDNGLFYGMTYNGGSNGGVVGDGVIFSFNPVTKRDSVLWNLGGGMDGYRPWGSLVYDRANGLYYGMTSVGGDAGSGAIISFNPGNNKENAVYSFNTGTDAQYPFNDLVYDAGSGLFYGMTTQGGTKGIGAIISFNPVTNKESVLWNLGSGSDGSYPYGNLIFNAALGKFYGTTGLGGGNSVGTIISFNPATNAENVEWYFGSGTDGSGPFGSLVYNAADSLYYGMTLRGGTYKFGTVFSFNPFTGTEKVLWNFGNGMDGKYPQNSFTLFPANLATTIKTVTHAPLAATIYPNPTNGRFIINGLYNGQTVELYNYTGQKISSTITENTSQPFDISAYASGIYLVRILNADGTLAARQKVVKQ